MPEMGGLDLQQLLAEPRGDLSIVFISGHGDISTSVCAMECDVSRLNPKGNLRKAHPSLRRMISFIRNLASRIC
jgi:DNA-binding NtrC family response regulator